MVIYSFFWHFFDLTKVCSLLGLLRQFLSDEFNVFMFFLGLVTMGVSKGCFLAV